MDSWEQKLKGAERRFYSNPKISEINKGYVKEYLNSWNARPATITKFYNSIYYFLEQTQDFKADMQDLKKIAEICNNLYSNYSPSTYKGTIAVTKQLALWLNLRYNQLDELPKSFSKHNIKQLTDDDKNSLLRASRGDYSTLEWEEGIKLISYTNDIQDHAFIMVELEAGFRPSEYLNINYGNVTRQGKFFIISIPKTKTAKARDVILYKSAPFLSQWMANHPIKEKNSPLWVLKRVINGNNRYTENAAKKLLSSLSTKAKIGKKLSLYMLRHSAARLMKLDNVNPDLASKQLGHSIRFFSSVYGKTSTEDNLKIWQGHYKENQQEQQAKEDSKPKLCPVCDSLNQPNAEHCLKCNSALSLSVALKEQEANKEILEAAKLIKEIFSDPEKESPNKILEKLLKKKSMA